MPGTEAREDRPARRALGLPADGFSSTYPTRKVVGGIVRASPSGDPRSGPVPDDQDAGHGRALERPGTDRPPPGGYQARQQPPSSQTAAVRVIRLPPGKEDRVDTEREKYGRWASTGQRPKVATTRSAAAVMRGLR